MFILTLFLSKLATPYGSNVRKNRKYFRYQGRNHREKITTLTCERFFHVVYQLKQPLSCVEEREGGGALHIDDNNHIFWLYWSCDCKQSRQITSNLRSFSLVKDLPFSQLCLAICRVYKWDKFWSFNDQFSVHYGLTSPNTRKTVLKTSQICPFTGQSDWFEANFNLTSGE